MSLSRRGARALAVWGLVLSVQTAVVTCAIDPDARAAAAAEFRLAQWPQRAQSPDFNLTDFDGRRRTLAGYRGRVVVVFFGFVQCPDVCPAQLVKLSAVLRRLGQLRRHVQVLFVTLDPERDTRQLLKAYVTGFDPRFVGLTGTNAEVQAAADDFYVEYARVRRGAGYTMDHSTSTFVLDAAGRLRLIGAMSNGIDDYVHDLAALSAGLP